MIGLGFAVVSVRQSMATNMDTSGIVFRDLLHQRSRFKILTIGPLLFKAQLRFSKPLSHS